MRFFRAAPFAFVGVGNVVESTLSDIRRHPHPRLPVGRLKSRKNKKSAFGGKKSPAVAGTKTTANKEPTSSSYSYRVAAAYGLPAYSCFCTGDCRTFFTASDTFFLPFRLTMSIIMRTFAPIYIIRYGKTE